MKTKAKATVTATAAPKAEAKAEAKAPVIVSATIQAAISTAATAQIAANTAIKASEKQVVKLGTLIGADKAMAKATRQDAQAALKPFFVAAYKDDVYAVQQLSRVLTIAFPGGQKADGKAITAAKENMAKAIANNADTQTILGMASGKLSYRRDGAVQRTGKRRQGGSNAKTPAKAFEDTIGNAVTAAHTGKVPPLAMVNILLDALKACEAITEDEADDIGSAAKKAL